VKKRGIIILTTVALACLLFLAFVVYKVLTMPPLFPPYDFSSGSRNVEDFRKAVGSKVGCKLPLSARDVHYWHDGGRDPTEWIAFTVDATDLALIKEQLAPAEWATTLPELPRKVPDEFKSWWHPSSTNIEVKWEDTGPYKHSSGRLWIIDYSTATIYFCLYSS